MNFFLRFNKMIVKAFWWLMSVGWLFCNEPLYAQLNANFQSNRSQGCAPLVVFFANTSTGSPDSCLWDLGNGNTSVEFNPATTFTTSGNYTVTLTVFKSGLQSTISKQITIFRDPVADFVSTDLKGCAPYPVSFKDRSIAGSAPITNWLWDYGDGRGASVQNPTATYVSQGVFDVRLIVTDANGCRGTIVKDDFIEVVPNPVASFSISDSIACTFPFSTRFRDSSRSVQPLSYLWNFGDGATSTQQNPQHTYLTSGKFNVRLEVTNAFGCKDDSVRVGSISVESDTLTAQLSDTVGCEPAEISYTAILNVPIKSVLWDFGDGQTSSTSSGTLSGLTKGVYPVTVTSTSVNNCIAKDTVLLRIGQTPVVDFSATPTEACRGPLNVQFTNLTTGASTFRWSFEGGGISLLANPIRTFNQAGRYFVRLTATSPEGCTAEKFVRDYIVVESPVMSITSAQSGGCQPFTTSFSLNKTGPGVISNILWDFGNGNTYSGIVPPPQTYTTTGNFVVRATVQFSDNCPQTDVTTRISVGNPIVVNGNISARNICANTPIQLSAAGGGGITVFEWDMGNGQVVIGRNLNYIYRLPGTFTVKLTARNLGCPVTINLGEVVVNPPAASFNISTLCGGLSVNFRNTSEGATRSAWFFGDGSQPLVNNNFSNTHTFPSYGLYDVKLVTENSSSGCRDSVIRQVDLRNDRPPFPLSPQIGCLPFNASFSYTDSIFRSIVWDLGDTIITRKNTNYTYKTPGSYNVNVYTLDVQGCRDTFRFKDFVKVVKPDAAFAFDPVGGCAPITVNFSDTSRSDFSNITSRVWNFGGLGTSTQRNPVFSFSLTDTVPIQLIVTDNLGCRDTVVNDLPISFPKASFTAAFNSICTGTPFPIQNNSFGVALQYFWDYGDGRPISNDSVPLPIYNDEGVYSVSLLVVDDNGCRDSMAITDFIKVEDFTYDFTADNTFKTCPELITQFSAVPTDIIYNELFWSFGNGNESRDTSRFPVNIYTEAGVYNVALYLEDFRGCRDTIIKNDFIRIEGPTGIFKVLPDSGCAPLEVVIEAEIKNSKVNFWDFGDGVSLLDTLQRTTLQHTYRNPGRASTSLVLDDGVGCVVLVKGPTVFVSYVDAEILPSANIACNLEELTFTDISKTRTFSPIVSRKWDFGDGTPFKSDSIVTHAYEIMDTRPFTVKLTATNSLGCFNADSILVNIFREPPLTTNGDKTICLGDAVQLMASGVAFYDWSPNIDINDVFSSTPLVRPVKDAQYIVKGYDIPTCIAYDTVKITVIDRISGVVGPDTTICFGDSVQLFVNADTIHSGKYVYKWSPAYGIEDVSIANPIVKPRKDEMYTLTLTNGNCKEAVLPVFIQVVETPEISVTEDVTLFSGQSVLLSASVSKNTFVQWSPSDGLSCIDCLFPRASPSSSINYTVTAINESGCIASEDVRVTVLQNCNGGLLTIPNVFTPNNDGLNDQFTIRGKGIRGISSMKIFSRTGELVFENFDINRGWDGLYNGIALNSGVYVYYVEFVCENGETSTVQGNITLLR